MLAVTAGVIALIAAFIILKDKVVPIFAFISSKIKGLIDGFKKIIDSIKGVGKAILGEKISSKAGGFFETAKSFLFGGGLPGFDSAGGGAEKAKPLTGAAGANGKVVVQIAGDTEKVKKVTATGDVKIDQNNGSNFGNLFKNIFDISQLSPFG